SEEGLKISFWQFARQYLTSPPFLTHVLFGAVMGLVSFAAFMKLGSYWSLTPSILLHAANNIVVRMGWDQLKGLRWLRLRLESVSDLNDLKEHEKAFGDMNFINGIPD